jgi:hypothetical protein
MLHATRDVVRCYYHVTGHCHGMQMTASRLFVYSSCIPAVLIAHLVKLAWLVTILVHSLQCCAVGYKVQIIASITNVMFGVISSG